MVEKYKGINKLPKPTMREIEADSFWCMSKLLDGIQDNYTFAQPGIQLKVVQLKELIQRINGREKLPLSTQSFIISLAIFIVQWNLVIKRSDIT